jgi:nicotinamide mononucleotide adenylyltransferase
MKFAVFSGRFDPIHVAHLQSIVQIAKRFDHVLVPILDYSDRAISAHVVKGIAETLLDAMIPINNVTFVVNNIHFGKITFEEYNKFISDNIGENADVMYLSGNPQVIEHMKEIGVRRYEFFKRFHDDIYTGTMIRKEMEESNGSEK